MNNLRDALDPSKTDRVASQQKDKRDAERQRIRDKMPAEMREFCDEVRSRFPGSRLVGIEFSDGERMGKP